MKDALKQVMKESVKTFMSDDSRKGYPIPMTPISEITEVLEELGYKQDKDKDDTNGWQIDFWYHYKNNGNKKAIMLSGSLHYGQFVLNKEVWKK